jgi:hypothetical protein
MDKLDGFFSVELRCTISIAIAKPSTLKRVGDLNLVVYDQGFNETYQLNNVGNRVFI